MKSPSRTGDEPLDELAQRREAYECAEAHDDDPEAATWLAVAAGEQDVEALAAEGRTPAEIEAARELLAPLDPAIEAAIVERMVARQLAAPVAARPATVVAERPGRASPERARARRWWFGVPLGLAAAALLVFNFVGGEASTALDGEVRVSAAMRGGEASGGGALVVRQLAWFYLDCGAAGGERDMLGVIAESAEGKPAALLRAEPPTPTSNGHWHVQADLKPGRWEVGCNVFDHALARPLRLRRAAMEVTP